MADLSITESQVQADTSSSGARVVYGTAGEAFTAGATVYWKSSDGKWWKADADASATLAAGARDKIGIAVGTASGASQIVGIQTTGSPTIGAGASVTAGAAYYVSTTAGGICPEADITTGDFICYVGVGNSSNGIDMPRDGMAMSTVANA